MTHYSISKFKKSSKKLKILILNWRDIQNPKSGGAELLTHELAKGWAMEGHHITQFSPLFKGGEKIGKLDNIYFIRKGNWWTVHLFAFVYYMKNRNSFDIIIDEVHWFPFFAAIYANDKTIALTCERATKLFPKLFPLLISHLFKIIENFYFMLYKSIPTMTISESTKKDLIAAGIKRSQITVLPMGITLPKNLKKYSKEKSPTFIYLARINKQKGIYDAILAFAQIRSSKSEFRNPKLWIVGSGEEKFVNEIKTLTKEKGLERDVRYFGLVSEEKKFELLARSHILLVPSLHEGWGLTVPEAASQKTPSIVYNVAGLRDIVDNQETGIIVSQNTPDEISNEAIKLLKNKALYKKLQTEGLKKVKAMNWKNTVKKSLEIINDEK